MGFLMLPAPEGSTPLDIFLQMILSGPMAGMIRFPLSSNAKIRSGLIRALGQEGKTTTGRDVLKMTGDQAASEGGMLKSTRGTLLPFQIEHAEALSPMSGYTAKQNQVLRQRLDPNLPASPNEIQQFITRMMLGRGGS